MFSYIVYVYACVLSLIDNNIVWQDTCIQLLTSKTSLHVYPSPSLPPFPTISGGGGDNWTLALKEGGIPKHPLR